MSRKVQKSFPPVPCKCLLCKPNCPNEIKDPAPPTEVCNECAIRGVHLIECPKCGAHSIAGVHQPDCDMKVAFTSRGKIYHKPGLNFNDTIPCDYCGAPKEGLNFTFVGAFCDNCTDQLKESLV